VSVSTSVWDMVVCSDVGGIVMPLVTLKKAEPEGKVGETLEMLPKVEEPMGKPPAGEEMVLALELFC
jgi:hypothetical protein